MLSKYTSLAALALFCSLAAQAEVINLFTAIPPGNGNSFTIIFQGDVRTSLNLPETQSDPLLNPFQYVNQNIVGSGTTSVTSSLDGGGNTEVLFTGSNPILPSYSFSYGGSGNGEPHFGVDGSASGTIGGNGPALDMLSQTWNALPPLPALSVNGPVAAGPNYKYVLFFADVTSGSQTVGQWFEVPYAPGPPPPLTVSDFGGGNVTLSNAGYLLSPTMIPLDDLNFNDYPPPGQTGSPFIPLPGLDGDTLRSGESETEYLPEPTMALPLLVVAVAGCFWRKRTSA